MPKAPILSRTLLYARLTTSKSDIRMPFNLVNTSLGAMVEPVSTGLMDPDQKAGVTDLDMEDQAWTDMYRVEPAAMFQALGTWGATVPYTLDPTP